MQGSMSTQIFCLLVYPCSHCTICQLNKLCFNKMIICDRRPNVIDLKAMRLCKT